MEIDRHLIELATLRGGLRPWRRHFYRRRTRQALARFLSTSNTVTLRRCDTPHISILLAVFNQPDLVFACLMSLARSWQPGLELILVDDGSAPQTAALLDRIEGAVFIRHRRNEGFVKACNAGARHALGDRLLLLNSDTVLFPNAIAAAAEALTSEPGAGIAGGRLLFPSGALQEAGCRVLPNGRTLGIGRARNRDRAEYLRRRRVDYVSGAFLLTTMDLWRELNGFDERFSPGYCEDVDYCLRARRLGLSTVYEPAATVLHFEHGSTSRWRAGQLMRRNRLLLKQAHQGLLAARPNA